MRNIFLDKSYTKCGRETSPRPFSKISKLSISLDQGSGILYSVTFKSRATMIYQNYGTGNDI